jgi:hypothetical protein
VKRLFVALTVVVAIALLALLLWPEAGEVVVPYQPSAAPDEAPPAAPDRARRATSASPAPKKDPLAFEAPPIPVATGVLACEVVMADGTRLSEACSLRVLLPSGEELASKDVSVPGTARFTHLPAGVPLVVAVRADGCLSGLCCDVVLDKLSPSSKRIALLRGPTLSIELTGPRGRPDLEGLRVELMRGASVVAEGTTGSDGDVEVAVPTFGLLRARVSYGGATLVDDASLVVEPTSGVQRRTIEVLGGTWVEVQVLQPSGSPAPDTPVWLVGDSFERAPVLTDAKGVAVFGNFPDDLSLTAVARGRDGTFASIPVTMDGSEQGKRVLLLGDPAVLTGDVVDQGNAAIRDAIVRVTVRPSAADVAVSSDDAGTFATPELPGGLAEVVVTAPGYLEWRSPEPVEIRPGVGAKIRARLTPRPIGTVFVRVRDESGAPVANAEVIADPARARTTTNESGECRFDGLEAASTQSFFARRAGYRARAGAVPSARVPRDSAATVDVVLRAARSEPPDAGPVTATGVVLDPKGEPVAAARVVAGPAVAFSGADGRFRLTGLVATAGDPVDLRITAPPAMLDPLRVLVQPDDAGLADLGEVRMRRRPYALIEVPLPPGRLRALTKSRDRDSDWRGKFPESNAGASRAFWFSSNHAQTLAGSAAEVFDPIACVTYDGTWMHLPPADDWERDGRGEAFLAYPTSRGIFTTTAAWTLAPDTAPRLVPPPPPSPGSLVMPKLRSSGRSKITLSQVACTTLFDPKSIHVPTGDPQDPVDPFAPLAAWRTISLDENAYSESIAEIAPGRWRLTDGRDVDTTVEVLPGSRGREKAK